MRVLLLEDAEPLQTMMINVLETLGHKVVSFTHPKEALLIDLTGFDLLVTDNMMPGMNGDEFIASHWQDRPAVIWSSTMESIKREILPKHVIMAHKSELPIVSGLIVCAIEEHRKSHDEV